MSDMIEQVANTLYERLGDGMPPSIQAKGWKAYRELARSIIEAMREPTEEMCEAGAAYYHDNYQAGHAKEQTTMPDIWAAIIDEALKTVSA